MAGILGLALIGDKGFDAGWLRERLRAEDMEAVIPLREGTSGYAEHDGEKYKWRHLVENFFCSIKAFRHIARDFATDERSSMTRTSTIRSSKFPQIRPARNPVVPVRRSSPTLSA